MTPGQYYGHGLPYLPLDDYPARIIAIEGTDGVGRSTQIRLLREWLEVRGYGVDRDGLDAIAADGSRRSSWPSRATRSTS